ncbi:hypothetical protein [Nocardia terpenica]|uniref:Uncharacterized protein n=1 Tax=Nocardia terpenica TaxID=455432 RepID=A0A6G9ZDC8_9NOCA|nr:hypothetical protein [Nocardia terpenica]QIS23548.1 hypothetical protein F6W96_39975 [Nocardia terpenica]
MADMGVIEQVKSDLADWRLGRVVTIADTGVFSRDNMTYLQRGGATTFRTLSFSETLGRWQAETGPAAARTMEARVVRRL